MLAMFKEGAHNLMCGDPLADIFLMIDITLATPIGFAFMYSRRQKRKEMSDLSKLR